MALLDNFKTHKVLEANLSTGLRTGHMLAQHPFAQPSSGVAKDYIDNGLLFTLGSNGELALATATTTEPVFIHYTEELQVLDFLSGRKYFTVEYEEEGVAYPRCIALYVGDVWTTDNFVEYSGNEKPASQEEYKYAIVNAGQFAVCKSVPSTYNGHVWKVNEVTTLPAGQTGVELMFVK